MGILRQGTVLTWEETRLRAERIKNLGIEQFKRLWDSEAARQDDEHKWGDEIEYMLVHFDEEPKNATLAMCQDEVLQKLISRLSDLSPGSRIRQPAFVTEFAKYQVETSPGMPYTTALDELLLVESNMHQRREMIRQQLGPNEVPVTLSNFPRLGASGIFTYPPLSVSDNGPEGSLTVPETLTGSHNRYETINANMIAKRGSNMFAWVPVFTDTCTTSPFYDPVYLDSIGEYQWTNHKGLIFLDSTLFGAGCCCMQVTQQLKDLDQARKIYDALLPLTPLLMALSASSPAWRGYLCDTDCRWNVASNCLDDRTQEEYQARVRPRLDICGMYLSRDDENRAEYNDVEIPCDDKAYQKLRRHGIDELLSRHIASIFSREPLIAYDDDFDDKDTLDMNHFNNLLSSVWQALRLKPPHGPEMGWRVEFRTLEASITDFESAAYAIFLVLFTGAVLHFNLNLYIPISKVRDNMHVAHRRNAVKKEKFNFRRIIHSDWPQLDAAAEYEEMTINEIFNGSVRSEKTKNFPGLMIFVEKYIEMQSPDEETKARLFEYISYIRGKAQGTYMTTAMWIRNFVRSHPKYQFDSVISEEVCYDLMVDVDRISRGEIDAPRLLPK